MRIKCPECGYGNIDFNRQYTGQVEEQTECSRCGCHYTFKITVEQTVHYHGQHWYRCPSDNEPCIKQDGSGCTGFDCKRYKGAEHGVPKIDLSDVS